MEKSYIPHNSNFTFFTHTNYCAQIIFLIFSIQKIAFKANMGYICTEMGFSYEENPKI